MFRRLYSTQREQGKNIMSFLERMDKLNKTDATKAGGKVNLPLDDTANRVPKRAQDQRHGQSRDGRPQRSSNKNSNNNNQNRPQRYNNSNRPQQRTHGQGQGQGQQSQQRQNIRAERLKDDSFDLISSGEKLETFVTPKQFGQRNVPIGSRNNQSRQPRRATRQVPLQMKKRIQAQGSQKGPMKNQRQPPNRSKRNAVDDTKGGLSPLEAVQVLKRKASSTTNKNGFIDVEQLSYNQLGPNFANSTADGAIWSAATHSHGNQISQIIKHGIKGVPEYVESNGTDNITMNSLTNTLNQKPDFSKDFKSCLVNIASGKASVASLKQ